MLPDRFFIPLFLTIIGLTLYAAFVIGPQTPTTKSPLSSDPLAGFVIEDMALTLLDSGPGLTHKLINDPDDGLFIRAAAGQPPDQGTRSAGVFLALLPDIEQAWAGRTVHLAIELRQPPINPSQDVMIRYYSISRQNGPIVPCAVSAQWQTCHMSYTIPQSDEPPNVTFIGIWPDTKGLSRFIDVRRIEALLDKPTSNEPLAQPIATPSPS
ncbi:MAG: hypothetical protein JKX99_09620 [Robiginitomaculum sp.]|nr:hypothetical protein [Robiginitomaculum sp.]